MDLPFQVLSTDFDGTLFSDFANPPVPRKLQELIGDLQRRGLIWVINTGRDMSSLMETLGRASLSVKPDFLVLVEREIHFHDESMYVPLHHWNDACHREHQRLFEQIRPELPRLFAWVNERFDATLYEDNYSPFCLIAESNADADAIEAYLEDFCRRVPHLALMRNDIYARFCHDAYTKGTALAEIARRASIPTSRVLAIGDHLNDLPMLSLDCAGLLGCPANAIPAVKSAVEQQDGFVSLCGQGHGVAEIVEFFLSKADRSINIGSSGVGQK